MVLAVFSVATSPYFLLVLLGAGLCSAHKCLHSSSPNTITNTNMYSTVPFPPPYSISTFAASTNTDSVAGTPNYSSTNPASITYYSFQVSYTPPQETTSTEVSTNAEHTSDSVVFTQSSTDTQFDNVPPPPTDYKAPSMSLSGYYYTDATDPLPLAPAIPLPAYF